MNMEAIIVQYLLTISLGVLLICLMMEARCSAAPNFNRPPSSSDNNMIAHRHTHDRDDESSLLALKAQILVNSNTSLALVKNWSEGTPFCSWIGVSCGRRHPFRVTALNLSYMDMQGTIPEEIGNLSFLSYLNIRYNYFSGPIPETVGKLRRLRALLMRANRLSGQIPPTVGRLTKLERLSLSENQLTGNIPTTIFRNLSTLVEIFLYENQLSGMLPQLDIDYRLPNLQVLDLSANQLTGNIPTTIFSNLSSYLEIIQVDNNQLSGTLPQDIMICSHLPNLQELWLSNNQLNGSIPSSVTACGELETLSLYSNNFGGIIPVHIGNLSRLRFLYLKRNQLTGVIPTSIGNLSNLEELKGGENNLQGTIPSEIGSLSNLNLLNFGTQKKLNGEIPSTLFNLTKLQILSLQKNELSGILPPSIATGLPNLQEFYIGSNRFSGMIPLSISNLSQLTGLDLGNNLFSGHIPNSLGNLPHLEWLRLVQNQFTNNLSIPEQDFLSPLTNSKYLTVIRIEINPITGELPRSLGTGNLSKTLEQFTAFSCEISGEIPNELSNISSLIWLGIGENKLVGAIPKAFSSLINLQRLTMNDNMLQGPIPHSLCNMKSLYRMSLSQNMLSGQLPLCFGNLTSLREIYLRSNAFNSNIPSDLWFSSGIEKLYLADNFFDGTLSRDIGNLKSVRELDLSGNRLSGAIPESFSDLKELQYLDLSRNNLTGAIPKSLESLAGLDYFNVSFNGLGGEIPNEGPFKNFTAESFTANKGLCGDARFKVESCKLTKPKKHANKNSLLRYILPPTALIFVATTIIFLVIIYHRKRSTRSSSLSNGLPGLVQKKVTYYEILRATNNLDERNLIGRGSYGSVYKGEFSDAMIAAVKIFNLDVQDALKSFDIECQIMSNIRHRNLVKVITSCSNLDFKALVMEYMANGNLDKWLHSTECALDISQRMGVMMDVANALEYLHHGYSAPIIHCDLKPSNILLDSDMVAHVGDFGISKLLTEEQIMQHTKTLGTIGYMAPEYGSEGLVSTAVDVYSYGMILMEIFTRRKPTDEMFSGELSMKKWVIDAFSNTLMQIIDIELLNTVKESVKGKQKSCLTSIIKLALECTAEVPQHRPDIKDVLVTIENIIKQL